LIVQALGGCVTMTIRMYADRKKWDLKGVEVTLSQERVHSKDCDDCDDCDDFDDFESTEGYVHVIQKKVKLLGNLDDKQRARLMEIAAKCPVNKTLLNKIQIKTTEL